MHLLLASLALLGSAAWGKSLAGRGNTFHYIQSDGQVYGFGRNTKGALGTGDVADSAFPVQMLGVLGATDIAGGLEHVCIVDQGDAARCVGAGIWGQLGQGNKDSTVLIQVQGLASGVAEIHAGSHSCTMLTDRSVKCWGDNADGQLGDGTRVLRAAPRGMNGLESVEVQQIALGAYHTCVLSTAGRVLCAGDNGYWALGPHLPTTVTTMTDLGLAHTAVFLASIAKHMHCDRCGQGVLLGS
ncbi:hypothetical protein BASA81_015852 [Batrachochytrium salamandrivorans]|nr:hypothetical protein BASA81_015852 [Batrachochytrium salamandrivorans]